ALAESRPHSAPAPHAVAQEAAERLAALDRGIRAWQQHPWRRDLAEPPAIWSRGSSRLLDYGRCREATNQAGPPVLVLPSLVNRAYILDLTAESSLLRTLAAAGLRPLLLDWGAPGQDERDFDLQDYVLGRALPAAQAIGDGPLGILGYCMGGTLATGLAQLLGARAAALAVI